MWSRPESWLGLIGLVALPASVELHAAELHAAGQRLLLDLVLT